MAQIIKYNLCNRINTGTGDVPVWQEVLFPVQMDWSEANEVIAKREAHNGEYTIEDDGQPEPEVPVTTEDRVTNLEEALDLLLSEVTE